MKLEYLLLFVTVIGFELDQDALSLSFCCDLSPRVVFRKILFRSVSTVRVLLTMIPVVAEI